jgi:hypothetical protein
MMREVSSLIEDAMFHPLVTPSRLYVTYENNFGLDLTDLVEHLTAEGWTKIWHRSQPTILLMTNLLRFIQPQGSEALILRDSFLAAVQNDEIAAVKAVAYEARRINGYILSVKRSTRVSPRFPLNIPSIISSRERFVSNFPQSLDDLINLLLARASNRHRGE